MSNDLGRRIESRSPRQFDKDVKARTVETVMLLAFYAQIQQLAGISINRSGNVFPDDAQYDVPETSRLINIAPHRAYFFYLIETFCP